VSAPCVLVRPGKSKAYSALSARGRGGELAQGLVGSFLGVKTTVLPVASLPMPRPFGASSSTVSTPWKTTACADQPTPALDLGMSSSPQAGAIRRAGARWIAGGGHPTTW